MNDQRNDTINNFSAVLEALIPSVIEIEIYQITYIVLCELCVLFWLNYLRT